MIYYFYYYYMDSLFYFMFVWPPYKPSNYVSQPQEGNVDVCSAVAFLLVGLCRPAGVLQITQQSKTQALTHKRHQSTDGW